MKKEPIDEGPTTETSDVVMDPEGAECIEETVPMTIDNESVMGSIETDYETDDSCDELGDEEDGSSDEDVDSDLDI